MADQTSAASAICGIALGCTNDTASIRETPVPESASISATLASVGTGSSFCRPSRGPTSRRDSRSGRSLMPASLPRPDGGALLVECRDALVPVTGDGGGPPARVLHLQPCHQVQAPPRAQRALGVAHPHRRVGRDRI